MNVFVERRDIFVEEHLCHQSILLFFETALNLPQNSKTFQNRLDRPLTLRYPPGIHAQKQEYQQPGRHNRNALPIW
jgi:hypothetical protein